MPAFVLAVLAAAIFTAAAQAREVQPYAYSGTSIFTGGEAAPTVAVEEANRTLLVAKPAEKRGLISRYTLAGASAPFEGLGGASTFTMAIDEKKVFGSLGTLPIAVDNSDTPSHGNFYVGVVGTSQVFAYRADGTELPGSPFTTPAEPCAIAVSPTGTVWVALSGTGLYREVLPSGPPTGRTLSYGFLGGGCSIDLDSSGSIYAGNAALEKFDSNLKFAQIFAPGIPPTEFASGVSPTVAVDRGNDTVFAMLKGESVTQYESDGDPLTSFGGPDPAHFSYGGLKSAATLALDGQTHDLYVGTPGRIDSFSRQPAVTIPTVSTVAPSELGGSSAKLGGVVDGDGIDTTDCHFDWGKSGVYDHTAPCAEGNVFAGDAGEKSVTAEISGLAKGTTYHYRLAATNANGIQGLGRDVVFNAAEAPVLGQASADRITTDSARINFEINPNGGRTSYRIEIGRDLGYGASFPVPDASPEALANSKTVLITQARTQEVSGLSPDTEYHYRIVAANPAGETISADRTFRTFPASPSGRDACPNVQARQQTGAAALLDCRAYELVSAIDTGGYDVRSDLDGQVPLPAFPNAADRALYSMRSGTIPGIAGDPTNRGADPYVASRGPEGWSTKYVGVPATNPFAPGPFASPLLGADADLTTFAFGGEGICEPCFADGSTNVPLRLASGELVEGMAGSISPGASERAGTVREPFSKDGSHLVFGSTAQLEPAANSNGTDATIYSRDLGAGTSEVISTLPDGTTIQGGPDVAELGISVDGTKTVVGELLSTDAEGNHRYHLYLHQRGIAGSTDLMPGATEGATYAGMTADGQSVYFTTLDPLGTNADQDTDGSADLYRAEVEGSTASLTRVSVGSGGTGDSDACDPAPNSFGAHWNGVGAKADCSVAAVAGGGGVASQDGSIFFLSPEQLDGSRGTQDEPNLYLSEPGGAPHFIATLESKTTGASPLPTQHPFTTSFGSFSLPQSIAVDQSAGYVYVLDVTAGAVKRFDTEGNPANFAAGPNAGTNALTGFTFVIGSSTGQIAVDNSGGANNGDLYVTNNSTALPVVKVISRTGAALGQLAGSSTPEGNFGGETGALRYPTGVAVGPTGALYVAGGASGKVYRYVPSTSPVAESDYQATLNYGDANNVAGQISADSAGNLYAIKLNSSGFLAGTGLSKYAASQFGQAGAQAGAAIDVAATASYVDPISDYLYASRGTTAAEYTPSGELQDVFGAGRLTASKGIAVLGSTAAADSRIFASSTTGAKNVSVFDARPAPSALVDNPLVAHAVHATDRQSNGDLQVTPQGSVALFDATLPLTGFFSARKEEIFRYDRGSDSLLCVSCSPNGATPEQGTTLARYGRNLSDDGRVFFTTSEPLALGDSNERKDAYEWEAGTQQLISTGTSPEDSSLLTVSADGRNALFFTRQQLVQEDQNGNAVRLYTAREDGGFVHGPPSFECAASDECHGAGSKPPSPASIGTLGGAPGQFGAAANAGRCAKGKVRRRGRCVKKPPKRHAHKRNHSARGGRG